MYNWASRLCKSIVVGTSCALFLGAILPGSLDPQTVLFASAAEAGDAASPTSSSSQVSLCGPSSRYVVGYYPTWKRASLMNVDMSKISHLQVAFGIPTDSGQFTFDGEWFLPKLVRDAHKDMTKISVSIGGWTGSNRLSSIMHDAHKRATFAKAISDFVEKYELDGVDLDWEYPGRQGSKCNKFNAAEDSGNLLRFLRALRASFHARFPDEEKLISLAVRVEPFDSEGVPMKDVSAFAEFVDFASIMAFDINGVWSKTTGPNAPLEHQSRRGMQYSFKQAVDKWLDAKWPAEKLVAGTAFYGRSLTTKDPLTAKDGASMYVPFSNEVPQGDSEDSLWYDVCENINSMSGVWQYKHLRDQGILKTVNTTSEDWVRVWDAKSSTPWLYNPEMRRFISYDDPQSLEKKVDYARKKGLKGMMTWNLNGDYNSELIDVLDTVGPLCRGRKTEKDTDSPSSSEASSSKTSSWTHSPPFASASSTHTTSESHSSSMSTAGETKHTTSSKKDHSSSSSSSLGSSGSADSSSSSSSSSSSEHGAPFPTLPHSPTSSASSTSSTSSASATSSTSSTSSTSAVLASSLTSATSSSSSSITSSSSSPLSSSPSSLLSSSHSSSSHLPSVSSTLSSKLAVGGKSIVFDDIGIPYVVNDGKSSPVPADLMDKLMKLTGATPPATIASASSAAESNSRTAMPIDSAISKPKTSRFEPRTSKLEPRRSLGGAETNLFDTPFLGKSDMVATSNAHNSIAASSTSQSAFAATFLLPIDTKSQAPGLQTTTVVHLSQSLPGPSSMLDPLASHHAGDLASHHTDDLASHHTDDLASHHTDDLASHHADDLVSRVASPSSLSASAESMSAVPDHLALHKAGGLAANDPLAPSPASNDPLAPGLGSESASPASPSSSPSSSLSSSSSSPSW